MTTATTSTSVSSTNAAQPATERRGILFIISAPSGTGKTTLCKQIVANIHGLWHSVSYTTRKPRAGETHGQEYFFTDEHQFQAMVERNEFVEFAHVYGNWYGTPRKAVLDKIEQGIDVLLEIDVQGAMTVKKKIQDAVYIFILPPSLEVLRERLQNRASDSKEDIQRRLLKVKEEVWSFREYHYIVRNDDLVQSRRELETIFIAERLKTSRLNMTWLEQNFIVEKESKPGDRTGSPHTEGSRESNG